MMKRVAQFVVKFRYAFIALFVAAVIVSVFLIPKVGTNYDMAKYLGNSDSVKALNLMESEFGSTDSAQVMVGNVDAQAANGIKAELESVDGVSLVIFDEGDEASFKDGFALFKVYLASTADGYQTVLKVREVLKDCELYVGGDVVESNHLAEEVSKNMVAILIAACVIILAILLLTSSSWIDPVVFIIVSGTAIVINLGTNIFMGDISYVTKSICAVMQLALATDYSIMLLHRFIEEREKGISKRQAVEGALANTFSVVSASSLTTIAGLLSLVFMRFTIGLDIGLVLAKGVLISLIAVFFLMPAVLMLFAPLIEKTSHKTLYQVIKDSLKKRKEKSAGNKQKTQETQEAQRAQGTQNAQAPKTQKVRAPFAPGRFKFKLSYVVPVALAVVIIAGAALNSGLKYSYTATPSSDPSAQVNVDKAKITEVFGIQNSGAVLLPKGDSEAERAVAQYLQNYALEGKNYISNISGMATTGLNDQLTKPQIAAVSGINEQIVGQMFALMGLEQSGTATLFELLEFLVFSGMAEQIASFNTDFTFSEFAALYNFDAQSVELVYALMKKKTTAKPYEVINYVYANINSPFFDLSDSQKQTITEAYNLIALSGGAEAAALTGAGLLSAYNDALFALSVFESENYTRIVFNIDAEISSDIAFKVSADISEGLKDFYAEYYIISESATWLEIKELFAVDVVIINIISFISILLIVLFCFKSLSVPVLLTLLIQGAVWINMSLNVVFSSPVFFLAYLIVMCIQMGATVDYGVLITSRYLSFRQSYSPKESILKAVDASIITVLTSGSILVIAAFLTGLISTVPIISAVGMLLSRGCLISTLLILLTLPPCLLVLDKPILKTTLKQKN